MLYNNDDPKAISAMEYMRTGGYGEENAEETDNECSVCLNSGNILYYNVYDREYVGCSACMERSLYPDGTDMIAHDIVECPICGAQNPDEFFMGDSGECAGCSECVKEVDGTENFLI